MSQHPRSLSRWIYFYLHARRLRVIYCAAALVLLELLPPAYLYREYLFMYISLQGANARLYAPEFLISISNKVEQNVC
jgi:hypothetical protein